MTSSHRTVCRRMPPGGSFRPKSEFTDHLAPPHVFVTQLYHFCRKCHRNSTPATSVVINPKDIRFALRLERPMQNWRNASAARPQLQTSPNVIASASISLNGLISSPSLGNFSVPPPPVAIVSSTECLCSPVVSAHIAALHSRHRSGQVLACVGSDVRRRFRAKALICAALRAIFVA